MSTAAADHRRDRLARVAEAKKGPKKRKTSLFAHGEPMNWLTAGALVLSVGMIVGLITLVVVQGFPTFWPDRLTQVKLDDGSVWLGEITRVENYAPSTEVLAAGTDAGRKRAADEAREGEGQVERRLLRIGNYELTNEHFRWVDGWTVAEATNPDWALVLERSAWGRFYGFPKAFVRDGTAVPGTPAEVYAEYQRHAETVLARAAERRKIERDVVGDLNHELESLRLAVRKAELKYGKTSPEAEAARAANVAADARLTAAGEAARQKIVALDAENAKFALLMSTADGREQAVPLADIVRAYPANRLGLGERFGVYFSRWREFLCDEPREANSEGGVFPAIFGTVVMTLLMSLVVVPFGVLAALYLREYAKQGPFVGAVRIAVNNLAGVPSIVFGVFGLGFFCYTVGAGIDALFFPERLPNPTFGTGGVLWSSATLALLTLPVVIVSSEEALAAVPRSMREGSYACGASKWQTMRRIVLPRAAPGIMTGMILAMARGAGEVAPLMLVGAVKLAPELPIDGRAPFLHPERSFMHLGFHIFDLGFQSQNSEAAKPMVYTTTLLLITIIVVLNIAAIRIRARLRKKFTGGAF